MSRFMAFAGTIAALSSFSFAWTITGIVSTEQGQPLPGVKITSTSIPNPNYQQVSDQDGSFAVSTDWEIGISPKALAAKASVNFSHNVITVSNVKARTMTVSVMDALGKVCASKTQHNVNGAMVIDLNKTTAKGAKFLRINADGTHNTYMLGSTITLLKEGDPMPTITFKLDGYKTNNYTMTKEVEEGVSIVMIAGSDDPESSSAGIEPESSSSEIAPVSSSETVSSSSAIPEPAIDCSGKTLKTDTELTIDGRKVIVKFPENFAGDKAVPMLINYHQIYGSATGWASESKIGLVALADGAISIYPDGVEGDMGQAWNVGPCCTTADDVQFTRDIIKELTEKACVNPKRIYTAGWSMGGGMTNYAGCKLADVIAAGASSAFDLAKEVVDAGQCTPARPYPIINFRSTNDGVVNYNGAFSQIVPGMAITFMGAKATFAEWAKMNGCTGDPKQNVPGDGCETYDTCNGGAKVTLCSQNIDHNEGDPQMAWDFVKQFSLP